MFVFGPILKITILMDISYALASIGIGSMFVGQTIFLSDIVDYGEFKTGKRSESITFSMKGFLQKMAYTFQTLFLFGGLGLMNYTQQKAVETFNEPTKMAIGIICFGIPPILLVISLIVFKTKFKLHGKLREDVHDYIAEKRANLKTEK